MAGFGAKEIGCGKNSPSVCFAQDGFGEVAILRMEVKQPRVELRMFGPGLDGRGFERTHD